MYCNLPCSTHKYVQILEFINKVEEYLPKSDDYTHISELLAMSIEGKSVAEVRSLKDTML